MTPLSLLLLYLAFRVKHFTCDFLLQTGWMAFTKGEKGKEAYKALFSHALIHAFGTLLIVVFFAPSLWWLSFVDFVIHASIDRMKGRLTHLKGWRPADSVFWWAFGLDQECHNLTHIAYICVIFVYSGGVFL